MLRSQRIQILTEWKFLSKREELIRFFEKDCQRQNVAAVAFFLFPREGTGQGALLGKQARRIASWIGDKLGEIKIKWRDNCINGATD